MLHGPLHPGFVSLCPRLSDSPVVDDLAATILSLSSLSTALHSLATASAPGTPSRDHSDRIASCRPHSASAAAKPVTLEERALGGEQSFWSSVGCSAARNSSGKLAKAIVSRRRCGIVTTGMICREISFLDDAGEDDGDDGDACSPRLLEYLLVIGKRADFSCASSLFIAWKDWVKVESVVSRDSACFFI